MGVLCPQPPNPNDLSNFFLIRLFNGEIHETSNVEVCLVARKSDLYLVGFKGLSIALSKTYFLKMVVMVCMILYSTTFFSLHRIFFLKVDKGNVVNGRTRIELGITKMHYSITKLYFLPQSRVERDKIVSKVFLVYVQMISEPLRLNPLYS
ncbi:rRNA N-glycosidase, partial [Striga asiatica]